MSARPVQVVGMERFELSRYFYHMALNHACLPVPPHPHHLYWIHLPTCPVASSALLPGFRHIPIFLLAGALIIPTRTFTLHQYSVGALRIELSLHEPESCVLPVYYAPIIGNGAGRA